MPLAGLATPELGAAMGGAKWMPAAIAIGALLLELADSEVSAQALASADGAPVIASPPRQAVEASTEPAPSALADSGLDGNYEAGVVQVVVRDERGVPVAGALGRLADPDRLAPLGLPSDANGELRLSLERQWARLEQSRVCIEAEGFATRVLNL